MSREAGIAFGVGLGGLLIGIIGVGASMSGINSPLLGMILMYGGFSGFLVALGFTLGLLRQRPQLPNPVVSWRASPQDEKFLMQVANGGARGVFSASVQILRVKGGAYPDQEEKTWAMVNLPWEGEAGLETQIGSGDFRQLCLASLEKITHRSSIGILDILQPQAPQAFEWDSTLEKALFVGAKGSHELFIVRRDDDEESAADGEERECYPPLEILLRLTITSDPPLPKPFTRVIRLLPSWDSIRAV